MGFFETSALDGSNIDEAFKLMASCTLYFITRNIEAVEVSSQEGDEYPGLQEVEFANPEHETGEEKLLQLIQRVEVIL